MTQINREKPEFYRDFMSAGFFPNANKITKYRESSNYWIFKTGERAHKIRKESTSSSTVPLERVFCQEVLSLLTLHSPGLAAEPLYVRKEGERFVVDGEGKKAARYYGIAMNQLSDRHFLDVVIEKGKATEKTIAAVAESLTRFHERTPTASSKEEGTPEQLHSILQDLLYQSKKYLGQTMSQATIGMILHPLERFLLDSRRLLLKRIRKGRIKKIHGCFIPRKINICKGAVNILARSSDPLKNRFADVASDVADLVVELNQAGKRELADFLERAYTQLSDDKEIRQVLPFYRAMKCLTLGNRHSAAMRNLPKRKASMHQDRAKRYYEQTIDVVHRM